MVSAAERVSLASGIAALGMVRVNVLDRAEVDSTSSGPFIDAATELDPRDDGCTGTLGR